MDMALSVGSIKIRKGIGYVEKKDHLSIRIRANKKFTNLQLEDWLAQNLTFKKGHSILDIGCGGGNFFPIFAKNVSSSGVIVGIDQSAELLAVAQKVKIKTPRILMTLDMNQSLPFISESFDGVTSTFAIYYVENIKEILNEIKRVLKSSAEVLFIGPGPRNVLELWTFNQKVFGVKNDKRIEQRSARLQEEFFPLMKNMFKNVKLETIPIHLIFPNSYEFVRYYLATLLYEESVEKTKYVPKYETLIDMAQPFLKVSKEVIVLRGKKDI